MIIKKSTVNKNVMISLDLILYKSDIINSEWNYSNINEARMVANNLIKRKGVKKVIMWRYWDFGICGKEILGIYYA